MNLSPLPVSLPLIMLWRALSSKRHWQAWGLGRDVMPVLLLDVGWSATEYTAFVGHVWTVLLDDGTVRQLKCHPGRLDALVTEGYTTAGEYGVTLLLDQDNPG